MRETKRPRDVAQKEGLVVGTARSMGDLWKFTEFGWSKIIGLSKTKKRAQEIDAKLSWRKKGGRAAIKTSKRWCRLSGAYLERHNRNYFAPSLLVLWIPRSRVVLLQWITGS